MFGFLYRKERNLFQHYVMKVYGEWRYEFLTLTLNGSEWLSLCYFNPSA
jgi:hypothetical protein